MCTVRRTSTTPNIAQAGAVAKPTQRPTQPTTSTPKPTQSHPVHKDNTTAQTYKSKEFKNTVAFNGVKGAATGQVGRANGPTADPTVNSLINASPAQRKKPEFYTQITRALQDPAKRQLLINHFGLNRGSNPQELKLAVFMEGGNDNRRNMMVTGEVIMNRAIVMSLAKNRTVGIAEVVKKPNQFQVNNAPFMHREGLKTFNEAMASRSGTQYNTAMNDPNIASVVNDLVGGKRGETGAIHYGFKGRGGVNRTDTPSTDYYTARSW